MAAMSHPMRAHGKTLAASDHLRSSSSCINGVPLRELGRTRLFFAGRRRDFSVAAKLRKVKKHEYPWPENPDPNVEGGVFTYLNRFKPLKEPPKPVILDFEKPLLDLQQKVDEVRKMANDTGLDFSDQITSLENKYQEALTKLYRNLTPIQRLNIARHPNRPTCLDHVFNITEKFLELHGDRAGYDDPAMVTGLGTIDGRTYMFIGLQKGRNTKENIQRNFGMPTPHGYRKALRMMKYADHHGFPIITFIDTPGAFADVKSEELGQGEAIAQNLRTMFGLQVPIVSIVIGEGGSGGALAIGCANSLLMLENAVFYVASPEACAAILWKSAAAAPKAAEKLKITAAELYNLQIADGVIPEPLGGAHVNPSWTSQQIRSAIVRSMDELLMMDTEELLEHRYQKFRKLGGFQEGIPIDPMKKRNMKKREQNMKKREQPLPSNLELENEVEKLKEQITKAKDGSMETPKLGLQELIQKLKFEIGHELSMATRALGLTDKLMMLQEELTKAGNFQDKLIHPVQQVERLRDELRDHLLSAPNYASLSFKLDMLKELSEIKQLLVTDSKLAPLAQEVTKKFNERMDRAYIKQKIEMLNADVVESRVSSLNRLDKGLKQRIMEVKNEMKCEFASVIMSMYLELGIVESNAAPSLEDMVKELVEEIEDIIEERVNSSDLEHKVGMLKLEAAKAGMNPEPESVINIQGLINEIKQSLAQALSTSDLVEQHKQLKTEVNKVIESDGTSNTNLSNETRVEDVVRAAVPSLISLFCVS